MRVRHGLILLCIALLADSVFIEPFMVQAQSPDDKHITVIDALERETEFKELPTRIVAPGKASWMLAHALYLFPEADERVLAMERNRGSASEFLTALYPAFADRPHVEMNAASEQIAPLKPDAIILKSYMKDRLGNSLEKLGFPIVYLDLETPEQFLRDITTLGELFGNPSRAGEIKAFYQTRLDFLQSRLTGIGAGSDRPDVLVIQNNSRSQEIGFQIPPVSWMQTIEIELAGGNPVWKETTNNQGWNIVNFEQIAAWNPDKIFVIDFRSDPAPLMEVLKKDSKWQALQAVKNGELYAFPADFFGWDVPDPRWILGTIWAATKIHPDHFAGIDMKQEIYDFYKQMYGMEPLTIDEQIMSRLTGDVGVSN